MNFSKIFNRQITSLHAAALIIGAAGFLSRLLGLLRDRLLASHFGAGDTLDAYYAAFQIPDALYTILLIGAASAAILPIFIAYRESGKNYQRFINALLSIFSVGAAFAVLLLIAFAPHIIPFLVPGFAAGKLALTVSLARILMVGPLFFGISGILASVLQAHRRFLVYALPPVMYNAAIIFGILVFVPLAGPIGLALGVLLGAILQVVVQLPAFFSLGFIPKFVFDFADAGVRRVARVSIPRVAALSFGQITNIALVGVASVLISGSVAVFRFASNLMYFPVGLFGVSYALAIFPQLSESAVQQRPDTFFSELSFGIRNILFWTLPIAFLFIVLRAHIVRVILGAGAFNWNDTRLVAASLGVLAIMIMSESLNTLLIRAFYAIEKTWEPLVADMTAAGVSIFGALAILAIFRLWPESLHAVSRALRVGDITGTAVLAVACAFALGSLANFALLFIKLRTATRIAFGRAFSVEMRPIRNIIGASILGGAAAYVSLLPFPAIVPTNTFIGIALQGTAAGACGFIVYFLALFFMHSEELSMLSASFRGHLYSLKKQPEIFEVEKLDGQESGK